jgi:hypothetical protein
MSIVKDSWRDLPGWGKMAIIGAAGLGVYKIYSWLTADQSGGNSQNVDVGNNVTYTNNQFMVFADALEAAFFSGLFGMFEDDELIGNILMRMRTTDDVARLTRVFGVRHIHGITALTGGNLVQLVQSLLDRDVKDKVNDYYEKNGINWLWL